MKAVWNAGRGPLARWIAVLSLATAATTAAASAVPVADREPLPGRPLSFRRLAIPDEVPAHLCTALAEDRAGFLWIGTQTGLVRFDGSRFRVFRSDPDDPRTLGGSYVRALAPASDGRLWVGTFGGGLSVYDPATETFTRYRHDPRDPGSLSHDRVEGVAEDRAGRIWIATSQGLDRLDPGSGRLHHFRPDPADPASLASERVRGLLVDRAGRVWVGSRDGLQVWRGDAPALDRTWRGDAAVRGRFERVASTPGVPGSLAGQSVFRLFEDGRGRIWIGTAEHGAAVLDPASGTLRRLPPPAASAAADAAGAADDRRLSHFWVYGFAEPRPDEVWIATFGGGVDVVDGRSLRVTDRLRHDPALDVTPGGDRIGALHADRSGVVWVGTWGQGIARHDPAARAVRVLRHSPARPDGPSHPAVVRALEMPDGTLLLGTNGNGVDLLSPSLRLLGGLRADPADPGALADGAVTCLAGGAGGEVWVATLDGTLHRVAPGRIEFQGDRVALVEPPRVTARLTAADGLPGGPIRTLLGGAGGELWAGSAEGLARIARGTLAITSWRHRPDDPSTLAGHAVEALAHTGDGGLWIGTDGGLNRFDPATGRAVRILHEPGRRDSLPNNWIPDLMWTRDRRLWVATQGGAAVLRSFDRATGVARFDRVAERLGRPAGPVESLIEDAQGKVWLGPRLRVDPRTWRFRELGPADGVAVRSVFIASRLHRQERQVLFGSPEGLLIVDVDLLAPWAYEPPVVATELRVDGVERPGAALLGATGLTLAPADRGFRLDFAALDFTAPEKVAYRHRLEGFDPRWIAAAEGSAAYTNLAPGRYTLRVRGTNRAGRFSPHELRLPVTVRPALHETAWFRLSLAAAGVALAAAGYRLRVRRLEARGRELERLVGERTAALEERGRELQAAYARIEEASLTDPLTGLRNRRYLEQSLAADAALAVRRHEEGRAAEAGAERATNPDHAERGDLVFLLLDLDHFKSVNDTHGHAAGDAVLVQTAAVLKSVLRDSDHLVRWGGEEFLAVARFVDRRDAPVLAEKIRAAIAGHPFRLDDGSELRRTCSLGFASYPLAPDQPRAVTWEEVVDLADLGLYAAKRSGRNGWVGIEAGTAGEDPREALRRFRDAPEPSLDRGEMRVAGRGRDGLLWK
jgi:diguanylate cyclase (GGDEF)-like protein